MNLNIIYACNCLMRSICFGGAAFLAYYDKSGWGWLIFAGIVTGLSSKDDEDDKINQSKDAK